MSIPSQPSSPSLVRWSRSQFEAYMQPRLPALLPGNGQPGEAGVDVTQAVSDLYDLVHGESRLDWSVAALGLGSDLPTPCAIAVAGVAISSVAVLIQAVGLPASMARAIGTRVIDKAIAESPAIVTTLEAEVAALMRADGIVDQASAVLALCASIGNVVSVGDVVATMTNELPPYQRTVAGAAVATQLTLWFATDRTAAIAELLLFATAIAGLAISAGQAHEICHPGATSLPVTVPLERGRES